MAAPGDPQTPDDHDDQIGFTSPSSLTGAQRPSQPSPEPVQAADEDDDVERDLFEDRPLPPQPAPQPAPVSDAPQWARETVRAAQAAPATARRGPPLEGAMGLYAVYALILFAVPTLGVSAVIGLLAVLTRTTPDQPLARSHFQYQKRTLVIAAIGAVLGVVLVAVNLGVFVLFALALWVLVRGAAGALRLSSGKPLANPQTLFI